LQGKVTCISNSI